MRKSDKKNRKTRSDKFPLTLHPTRQYCKKIRGKIYYFGIDKKAALESYLEQVAYLHAGKGANPKSSNNTSLKALCNLYLDHQQSRTAIREIKPRQVYDQTRLLRDFVRFIGPNCSVSNISTIDFDNLRVIFPKGKTGISRNLILWPETVEALKDISKKGLCPGCF
jgi:hypothetical protein